MEHRLSRVETWADWGETVPQGDEEGWELTIFKEGLADADFSCRTLPRTFIGRSLLERVSFHNSDLHGSHLCWNDFNECDFSASELSHAHLGASVFRNCHFSDCCLVRCDLRRSTVENCDFAGADFCQAKLTRLQAQSMSLTAQQRKFIRWQRDDGPEPAGG